MLRRTVVCETALGVDPHDVGGGAAPRQHAEAQRRAAVEVEGALAP